jgi:hypothetical protein
MLLSRMIRPMASSAKMASASSALLPLPLRMDTPRHQGIADKGPVKPVVVNNEDAEAGYILAGLIARFGNPDILRKIRVTTIFALRNLKATGNT